MGKVVKKFSSDFTMMPNAILNHIGLSFKAKGIWGYLVSKPDTWSFSEKGTTRQSKDGLDAVRSGIKELENLRYLKRVSVKNTKGQWDGYDYYLYDKPYDISNIDNPIIEKSNNGKQSNHSNTDLSNTNSSNKKEVKPAEKSADPPTLFGTEENPNKKTLFKNSLSYEYATFEKKLEKSKKLGVDINYYYNAIKDWNEIKKVTRTANGWVATARTFMRGDKDKGNLKMVKTEQQQQKSDAEMQDYLNM